MPPLARMFFYMVLGFLSLIIVMSWIISIGIILMHRLGLNHYLEAVAPPEVWAQILNEECILQIIDQVAGRATREIIREDWLARHERDRLQVLPLSPEDQARLCDLLGEMTELAAMIEIEEAVWMTLEQRADCIAQDLRELDPESEQKRPFM